MTRRELTVSARFLWLSLSELFTFRFMQTDPNWSNFLYDKRAGGQLSLIDFGACQGYDSHFVDNYLPTCARAPRAGTERDAILHYSHELGFLTGDEEVDARRARARAGCAGGLALLPATPAPATTGTKTSPSASPATSPP